MTARQVDDRAVVDAIDELIAVKEDIETCSDALFKHEDAAHVASSLSRIQMRVHLVWSRLNLARKATP